MIARVLVPRGFRASGTNSGVRRYRPDLGIIVSEVPCAAAGVFTRSTMKAAPVLYDAALLPSDNIRALVCNSGQANAATGEEGLQDNLHWATKTAEALKLSSGQVLVASTGVIGVRLPLDILIPALPLALRAFSDTINNFALAIMTTDLVPKFTGQSIELSTGTVTIAGAAKGSGMIHPNMGTMLGFILMDVQVDSKWLDAELRRVTDATFNMISVDGETSTNDTVIALANGASGAAPKTKDDWEKLSRAIEEVATELATSIARDGEGASKLVVVEVSGAPDLEIARHAARMITTSPLIKSAIHGEDPNWGRVLARLGQAGVEPALFSRMILDFEGTRVFAEGRPLAFDRAAARQKLRADTVHIVIDFQAGQSKATAWGCDLTKRYVEINTEYS